MSAPCQEPASSEGKAVTPEEGAPQPFDREEPLSEPPGPCCWSWLGPGPRTDSYPSPGRPPGHRPAPLSPPGVFSPSLAHLLFFKKKTTNKTGTWSRAARPEEVTKRSSVRSSNIGLSAQPRTAARPEETANFPISIVPAPRAPSRASRRGEAHGRLRGGLDSAAASNLRGPEAHNFAQRDTAG